MHQIYSIIKAVNYSNSFWPDLYQLSFSNLLSIFLLRLVISCLKKFHRLEAIAKKAIPPIFRRIAYVGKGVSRG